ncbi:MAG: carbohydrate porin [Bacteroidetes bacterium]|nr:carbohydrate porin [Bacteroidota bacterium]
MIKKLSVSFCLMLIVHLAKGQQDSSNWYTLHFQLTTVTQNHQTIKAPYSGVKSLQQKEKPATSLTASVFAGIRLFKNTELFVNPEMAGGEGMSSATGIAGFPNGETFRVGSTKPVIYLARAYLHHIIPLSQEKEWINDDANTIAEKIPKKYISLSAGKLSLGDFFDDNNYSHDPRKQFLNWSLMSAGAYDYAADVRGYTYAFVAEYISPQWEARVATALLPKEANGATLDWKYSKSFSWQGEIVRKWNTEKNNSTILRLIGFFNRSKMGNYKQALEYFPVPDVIATRMYSRNKWGWVINAEKKVNKNSGIFGRLSWNNGKNETWCFTEIDQSASLGYVLKGNNWKRNDDELGLAFIVNGISKDHRDFLAKGGSGFMIGDGKLNYSPELIAELYYKLFVLKGKITISPDYQFVLNPAYNNDRGPVHVIGLRFHTEW